MGRRPLKSQPSRACPAPQQQRLLRVEPVLGLVPHRRLRPVDHRVGHFLAAMRGQAVEEDRARRGARPSAPRRPGTAPSPPARYASCSWPIDTQVSVTTTSAPATASARIVGRSRCRSARRRHGAHRDVRLEPAGRGDRQFEMHQRRRLDQRVADIVAVAEPGQREPGQLGPRSITVSMSARIWHGCDRSVRPLITGTVACCASSSTLA